MTAKNYFQRLLDKISSKNIKAQIDIIPIVPETSTKQKNGSSAECRGFWISATHRRREERIREFFRYLKSAVAGHDGAYYT